MARVLRWCFVFVLSMQCLAAEKQADGFPRVQVTAQAHDGISFQFDGREILRYNYGHDTPRPYFFPVIGPAGVPVTRIGHPHDPDTHRHHLSLWIAHQSVDEVNVWEFSDKAGRIVHDKIVKIDDGSTGVLSIQSKWLDPAGKLLMTDLRTWQFIPRLESAGEFFLDLELKLTPAGETVTLGKSNFGLLAVRVAKTMGVKDGGGELSDSEGHHGEKEIFNQAARWCDYSGAAAPGKADDPPIVNGITLMDHPANPGSPVHWHVRSDGWMGASLTHEAALEIKKASPLVLRYRFWIHDGSGDREKTDAIWKEWSGHQH